MTDTAALLAQLGLLQQAYQQLSTTGGVARIREGNKWIEYHPASIGALSTLISDIQGQLRASGALAAGGRIRARRVTF